MKTGVDPASPRQFGFSANLLSGSIKSKVACDLATRWPGPLRSWTPHAAPLFAAITVPDWLPDSTFGVRRNSIWPLAHALLAGSGSGAGRGCWCAAVEVARWRGCGSAAGPGGGRGPGSDWATALDLWRRINTTVGATSTTYLGEGRACLALGRAAQAERALRKAAAAAPSESEAWLPLLEVMRVEDRPVDAFTLGWKALDHFLPEARPQLLRELTLAALTDLPDDLARSTLRRWIDADPGDVDARAAFLRRIGAEPRADDPERESRLVRLRDLLASHPEHVDAHEALVTALADAGEPEHGRMFLETWPLEQRDGRFWRLRRPLGP